MVVVLVWEGNRQLERFLRKLKWKSAEKIHPLLLFFLFSLPLAWLSGYIPFQAMAGWYLRKSPEEMRIASKLITVFAFRINLFLHCLNALVFFLNRSRQKELEAETLQRSHAQASLQSIRNQINPQFLFNNLTVLSALIIRKSDDANHFVEAFSAVYRYILNKKDEERVSLAEELEFIQPYLFLLEKRFESGLSVDIDIPEEERKRQIVPAALQLLVENAIKHNIVSVSMPLHISIRLENPDRLVVENTLQPKPDGGDSSQIGLNNIRHRYRLIAGQEITVTKDLSMFRVSIPLLKKAGA